MVTPNIQTCTMVTPKTKNATTVTLNPLTTTSPQNCNTDRNCTALPTSGFKCKPEVNCLTDLAKTPALLYRLSRDTNRKCTALPTSGLRSKPEVNCLTDTPKTPTLATVWQHRTSGNTRKLQCKPGNAATNSWQYRKTRLATPTNSKVTTGNTQNTGRSLTFEPESHLETPLNKGKTRLFTTKYTARINDEAFGYLKRVIVTPAVYPRLLEFLHFDIQSTGQKSHCVNTHSRIPQVPRKFHNWLRNYYPGNKIREPLFTQNEYINHVIASQSSPTISIFRANPYPEVTDLICRLPLPTLFYRLETLHLGDQLRILVRGENIDTTYDYKTEKETLPISLDGFFMVVPVARMSTRPIFNNKRILNRLRNWNLLQGLIRLFATTTKICANGSSMQAYAKHFYAYHWLVASAADYDFHVHRPAVLSNQRLSWYLHELLIWAPASSAYQKWPTGHIISQPQPSYQESYPEGNFGGNQLLDGSIGLSPLYSILTIDLHYSSPSFGSQHICSSYVNFAIRFLFPITCKYVRLLGPCFKTGPEGSSGLTSKQFHVLFNSLFRVLFNFPSRAALSSNTTLWKCHLVIINVIRAWHPLWSKQHLNYKLKYLTAWTAICVQNVDVHVLLRSSSTHEPSDPPLREHINDPSAGSPTETLLRLLLPLNNQTSLNNSIGRQGRNQCELMTHTYWEFQVHHESGSAVYPDLSRACSPGHLRASQTCYCSISLLLDAICPFKKLHLFNIFESRSLSELTRQITPRTKNGHAPPPIDSRKSYQSVLHAYVRTW
ncbi:hypothetical protein CVS40_12697 [Lucilia cuprina]|nr:hypothetical protein CVS40_12697 [Lucilia cuprina]